MANRDEFKEKSNKSKQTLKALCEQASSTHSTTLRMLLEKETNAYNTLADALLKLIKVIQKILDYLHNDIPSEQLEAKKTIKMAESAKTLSEQKKALNRLKQVSHLIEQMNLIQETVNIIRDECCKIFLCAIDRDYKNWGKIAGELGKVVAQFTAGFVPPLAVTSHILGTVEEVTNIGIKYINSIPNYSETDNQLRVIEDHIQILESTADFFAWVTEQILSWNNLDIQ